MDFSFLNGRLDAFFSKLETVSFAYGYLNGEKARFERWVFLGFLGLEILVWLYRPPNLKYLSVFNM